ADAASSVRRDSVKALDACLPSNDFIFREEPGDDYGVDALGRRGLERSGRKQRDSDLMIACTALEHEAALVTHDAALKDGAIGGLVVEKLARFGSLMSV